MIEKTRHWTFDDVKKRNGITVDCLSLFEYKIKAHTPFEKNVKNGWTRSF